MMVNEVKKEEVLEFQIRTDKVSNGIGYIRLITVKKNIGGSNINQKIV